MRRALPSATGQRWRAALGALALAVSAAGASAAIVPAAAVPSTAAVAPAATAPDPQATTAPVATPDAPPMPEIVPAPPPPPYVTAVAEALWQDIGGGFAQAGQGMNGSLGATIADIGPAQGAWVANTVLAAAGLVPRAKVAKTTLVATADPFRTKPPKDAPVYGGTALAQALAAQKLGREDLLAVGINQKFASSTSYQTDLALRHASGPIDVNVNVTGDQPLASHAPMALQYDGQALVAVVPQVQLGLAAKGPLGTLQDPTTQGDQTAGPLMRLKLQHRNMSLSTDAGYDFRLNPTAAYNADSERFHVKVGLNISL